MGYSNETKGFRFDNLTTKNIDSKEVWNSKVVEILIGIREEVDKTYDILSIVNTLSKYSHIFSYTKIPLVKFYSIL